MKHILTWSLLLLAVPAAAAQGDRGSKKDTPPDGLKALRHADPNVRYNAADLLVRLGPVGKFAAPALRELLQDREARVRVKAAEALWAVERPTVRTLLPVLLAGLKEKEPLVRINALVVLGRMGSAAKPALPVIGQALTDRDTAVRLEAILTLGEIGPVAKATVPALLKSLDDDKLRLFEPMVAVTLSNIGASAVPELTKALGDRDDRRRRTAAYALALLGPKAVEAVPALTKALGDDESDVRAWAVRALGKIGEGAKSALPKLRAALQDRDALVRLNAALAVSQVGGGAEGLSVLTKALKSDSAYQREQACVALSEFGAKAASAVPILIVTLEDKEPKVRAFAAAALGKLPANKAGAARLEKLLADPDEGVRLNAARALWRQADPQQREKLLDLMAAGLGNERPSIRKQAAVVIGDLGESAKAAVPGLLGVLRDPDFSVRRAAAAALRRIDPAAADRAGVR
ncbi:MAG: HEAT repeat domain-containing protein [Gemmataceae bacterium]|nr:HEAT repeat domain-containing protein [Gemmataceae bacterium]